MAELVTIATFSQPYEAHLRQASLAAEGITAYVQDDHTVGINWLYSNAIGGVRLQVIEGDAERAMELLADDGANEVAGGPYRDLPADEPEECDEDEIGLGR